MANTLKFGNGQWATQEGLALAYNDENDNYKPLPFDFTRASTATRVNKQGLIETVASGLPRIDYFNNTKGALLLEPSRTNSITYSNDFSQSIYGKINLTITANQGISPDGSQNANLLVPNAAVNTRYITNNTGSNLKINTVFLKKKELRYVNFGNAQSKVIVDLENGTISADTVSTNNFAIKNYGNGWYRVSCYNTLDVNLQIQVVFGVDGSGSSIATNGTDGVYIYGFEIQNGSYPTSYIPTQGSAVTRAAETCNNAGNEQVFNDSEGVLYAEIAALANDQTVRKISLSRNSAGNPQIAIGYDSLSNQIRAIVYDGTFPVDVVLSTTAYDILEYRKVALKYKSGDSALWVDGVEVQTSTNSFTITSSLNTLNFDDGGGIAHFYGNVKDIRVYNTALTDQELQALTS
jgi:hypothetical protein